MIGGLKISIWIPIKFPVDKVGAVFALIFAIIFYITGFVFFYMTIIRPSDYIPLGLLFSCIGTYYLIYFLWIIHKLKEPGIGSRIEGDIELPVPIPQVIPQKITQVIPQKIYCPYCGIILDLDKVKSYCPNCGNLVDFY